MAQNYPTEIEIAEGIEILLSRAEKADTEMVGIKEAYDRILAEDVRARENIPPFDRSPYDGYAIRSQDIAGAKTDAPVSLQIIEEVPAGHAPEREVGEGEAVKILTGAPIPLGADAVVKFEDTSFTAKEVCFVHPVRSGSNIVKAGEDVEQGQKVMEQGTCLCAASIGLLAGLGHTEILVYKKPKVCIISTGDELLDVEQSLQPGKIRNSSAYMLMGFLRQWGVDAEIFGIVPDVKEDIVEALNAGLDKADCVITTGGASVGDYDLTADAMDEAGADLLFWKVKMKPGMATLAGVKGKKLLLGLSGNPSAAAAALFLLGRPALQKMKGRMDWRPKEVTVCLESGFPKKSPGGRILPGVLEFQNGKICLNTKVRQANGMVSPWGGCNVVGLIEKGTDALPPGSMITALYFGE